MTGGRSGNHTAKCAAKIRRDQAGADRSAERLRLQYPGSRAYAYQCSVCLFWHVSCNCGDEEFAKKNSKSKSKQWYEKRVEGWERRLGQ